MTNNGFLVLRLLCYHGSWFRSLGSYLHNIFFSLFSLIVGFHFFSWVVSTCTLIWLVLLMDDSHPWFLYIRFFFILGPLYWECPKHRKGGGTLHETLKSHIIDKLGVKLLCTKIFAQDMCPWQISGGSLWRPTLVIFAPQRFSCSSLNDVHKSDQVDLQHSSLHI
jgi:hypothetical protein